VTLSHGNIVRSLLVAACLLSPATGSAAPVKIGVINAMTGPEAPIGEQVTNGLKLAEEDLKAQGADVQLVWEDDTGKPAVSMTALEKLATRDQVAGIVGPYSSAAAFADSKLAERHRIPLLIPLAAKEEITRQGLKWTFRIAATTVDRASVLIDMALALGQPKTIAILNENTDFGVSVGQSAKLAAQRRGLQVVFEEAYSKGSPDYRSTLAKIKSVSPDLVVMGSYIVDAILLMRQAREIGLSPMAFLGAGAGFALTQFAKETDISEGVLSATEWAPDVSWPGAAAFAQRYEKRFGKPPTYHASGAYASMMIMGEAALKAGGDREKIRNLLREGRWTGIVGDVAFTDYDGYTNQNRRQMLVQQVLKGQHETVWPPAITAKKPVWPFPGWK
jgi:branched-chain amino acid transport system substrate-binding protein